MRFARRSVLAFLVLVGLCAPVHAQLFDPNLNFIAGGQLAFGTQPAGSHRAAFLFSANYSGPHLFDIGDPLKGGTMCYGPGLGFDLRTVSQAFGEISGFGLTAPGLTCHIKGSQFAVQAGITQDLTGSAKTTGGYAAVSFSLKKPQAIAVERAARKAAKPPVPTAAP